MDTSSLIIGIVLALACAIPLVYIIKSQEKSKKKMKDIFTFYGQGKFNFKIKEIHYKKLFALDSQKKGFLFANLDMEISEATFIDLNEVTACQIEETTTGGFLKIIMHFKSKSKADESIVLYNLENDELGEAYWNENELIAKKWEKLIDGCL